MFRSITWRLTFWYSLILAVIIVTIGIVVFGSLYYILQATTLEQVEEKAAAINELIINERQKNYPGLTDERILGFPVIEDFFVQITDKNGEILNVSVNLHGRLLPTTLEKQKKIILINGHPFAYVSIPIKYKNDVIGYIQVARSMKQVVTFLKSLIKVLVVSGIFGLCLALFGGYFITRAALKPIDAITTTAEQISRGDLNKRIPLKGPKDELYRLAETFNRMLNRIEENFKKQQTFVADASHELRTPITVIEGYANLLARWGKDNPKVLHESIEAISRESRLMKRLINQLLNLARADLDPEIGRQEEIKLEQLVEEVCQDAEAMAEGLKIELNIYKGAVIKGNKEAIRQALMVLVDNAVKYNVPGGKVEISLDARNGEALISVEDTGIGISPEELPYIFERFYRADKSRSKKIQGTGLGLAIAKNIVESHAGHIDVKSIPGKGSCFTIHFPLDFVPAK
ncbi:MAG: hypothetical protein PWQ82_1032 [Thermosediminibacterales bacterium]|nr:hypothetical protein [Thermosediminibacterales bacterium]